MKDKLFIDTNILVYANDNTENVKYKLARQIILDGIKNDNIVISTQVLSEFYVTVTKKIQIKMHPEIALKEIRLLRAIEIVENDYPAILKAIQISTQYQLSFWDSLIIVAAISAKCSKIYSEDMNSGQVVEGVEIVNPFI